MTHRYSEIDFRIVALLRNDCFARANACAGSTIDAGISINHILSISLRDCTYWALRFTGSAAYTCVRNNICHDHVLLKYSIAFLALDIILYYLRKIFKWKSLHNWIKKYTKEICRWIWSGKGIIYETIEGAASKHMLFDHGFRKE